MKRRAYRSYFFEFLSILLAVLLAFALDNWNDNRRDQRTEAKLLAEINNGLVDDLRDVRENQLGQRRGIQACAYWRNALLGGPVEPDSAFIYYIGLTRDFISVQNASGYETLKSRGLEFLQDDELRSQVINLYEFNYAILRKLEEEYAASQFHASYAADFDRLLAPHFTFSDAGRPRSVTLPLPLSETDRKLLLTYLAKIEYNRGFTLALYEQTEGAIRDLQRKIGANQE